MSKKTFSIISLGCFRNTYDSEIVAKRFADKGYIFREDPKNCDVVIVNTCGFIDKAKDESIDVISEAIELKKNKNIKELFVFGCLVQRYKDVLEKSFPEVDVWWGTEDLNKDPKGRKRLLPSFVDFLKICEGCLHRCSYCAIPNIKGSLQSRPQKDILEEVRYLDGQGVKELNIIGQDITSWGKDFNKKEDLTDLVKAIVRNAKNIGWLRLIYMHPQFFTDSLLDLIAAESKICKYIDLPIQHINDRILKSMNRTVGRKKIESLIKKIRKAIPEATLRTSLIVGFPGETEKEFKELFDFVKDVKFERLGVFTYSREEDTPAYQLTPQVHHKTKNRRLHQLMMLQQDITVGANKRFLGKEMKVLIEEKQTGAFIGRSQYDAYDVDGFVIVNKKGLKVGNFYKAKITDVCGYDMVAE